MRYFPASSSMSRRRLIAAAVVGATSVLTTRQVLAQSQSVSQSSIDRIRSMRAGDYIWLPELAPEGPVLLVITIRAQRAIVYRNGIPIGVSTVSTGKEGHETPTGVFTILQKKVDHKSNLYNDAPMPFMQRLTWDGIALHAGNLPGFPASHGCVRLPMEFARDLFGITSLGMTVVIAGDEAVPRIAPTPSFLEAEASSSTASGDVGQWDARLAASPGPISIVVSAADKRIMVLRNGVQIGSSSVAIQGPVTELGVFTLASVDPAGFHWFALNLLHSENQAGRSVTQEKRARLQIPEQFQQALRGILTPGTTAIVTPESLQAAQAGQTLIVVDSEAEGER